jgi:hypothetical protein
MHEWNNECNKKERSQGHLRWRMYSATMTLIMMTTTPSKMKNTRPVCPPFHPWPAPPPPQDLERPDSERYWSVNIECGGADSWACHGQHPVSIQSASSQHPVSIYSASRQRVNIQSTGRYSVLCCYCNRLHHDCDHLLCRGRPSAGIREHSVKIQNIQWTFS